MWRGSLAVGPSALNCRRDFARRNPHARHRWPRCPAGLGTRGKTSRDILNIRAFDIRAFDIRAFDIRFLDIRFLDIRAFDICVLNTRAFDICVLNTRAFDTRASRIAARDASLGNAE